MALKSCPSGLIEIHW